MYTPLWNIIAYYIKSLGHHASMLEWDPLENTSFTRTTKITRIVSGVNEMSFITFLFQQFKTVLHWTITEYTYKVSEYSIYLCLPQKLTDQKRNAWEAAYKCTFYYDRLCVYSIYMLEATNLLIFQKINYLPYFHLLTA